MVNLLFEPDADVAHQAGHRAHTLRPRLRHRRHARVAEDYLRELNPEARLEVFGQEYNPESYAICGSDMMIKGQNLENIKFGDSFTDGRLRRHDASTTCSPTRPSASSGSRRRRTSARSTRALGFDGRFGAGLPRINDGSLLFLQHMIIKMKPGEGRSRLAIVFNGSPLFTGDAGSGESNIRRWIIENDWLEAIVALPDQLFYNTGISTYIWIVTNRKRPERRGKVQLIDARGFCQKMRKSLGNKRNELSRRAHRRDHAHLRRVHRGRALQDLRQRGLRLPQDHRGAAAAAELPGQPGADRAAQGAEGVPEARRTRTTVLGDAHERCPGEPTAGAAGVRGGAERAPPGPPASSSTLR